MYPTKNLEKEQKKISMGNKFKCPFCDYTFTKEFNKQRHLKTHNNWNIRSIVVRIKV